MTTFTMNLTDDEHRLLKMFATSKGLSIKDYLLSLGVLDEDIYENCWGPDYENGIITDDNNIIGFVHGTAFGDGSYDSMSGKTYGVDAGALGIFDSSYCKDLNELRNDDDVKVIDVDDADSHTIKLSYEDGTFTFYIDNDNVEEIYTGDPQEDDEYDEETDSDDYFYDENFELIK